MKKLLGMALCLAVLAASFPVSAGAADTAQVIDMHGARTYIGTASNWSKSWNESNFEEITNADVSWNGSVTVKSGVIRDLTVTGSSSALTVNGGTINSIQSDGNITLKGGTVKKDVESEKTITINGKTTVKGACIAEDITATGTSTATITTLKGRDTITLDGASVKTNEINGDSSGTLVLKKFTLSLPNLVDLDAVTVNGDATVSGKIDAGVLSIAQKVELNAGSTVEVGTLKGPGTLAFVSGRLTVHSGISDMPVLRFTNSVNNGTLAFRADSGEVDTNDVAIFDYDLRRDRSGNNDAFYLENSIRQGITLSSSSASVDRTNSVTIRANVNPSLSKFAYGTKIKWTQTGDTSSFSFSPSSDQTSCKVTLNGNAASGRRATLTAYLVDQRGDRLTDYKSGSCTITSGSGQNGNTSYFTLDTSAVTIPKGGVYWVLAAMGPSASPAQLSYNSAVGTVGAPKWYQNGGKTGWLYPVYGVAKGQVTIDIGGQKMITTVVDGSIIMDTASYTMVPGGKYVIGVRVSGLDLSRLNVYSESGCAAVQYAGTSGGLHLYAVRGISMGYGDVVFSISGGQSVRAHITVQPGAQPGGVSARLIAAG